MEKPTIILATSNGVGMGHLARASAIALALKEYANPIIVSMAGGIAEIPEFMGIRCEYIPGRDRMWMTRENWDAYLRDRYCCKVFTPKTCTRVGTTRPMAEETTTLCLGSAIKDDGFHRRTRRFCARL